MAYRVVPTKTHGVLDYLIALFLIILPFVFGVWQVNIWLAIVPVIAGGLQICYSVCTYYEVGIFKLMGVWTHLILDVIIGVVLMAAPLPFSLIDWRLSIWLPYPVAGGAIVVLAIFTKTAPAGTITPANAE